MYRPHRFGEKITPGEGGRPAARHPLYDGDYMNTR
jgi:hypothetical protein